MLLVVMPGSDLVLRSFLHANLSLFARTFASSRKLGVTVDSPRHGVFARRVRLCGRIKVAVDSTGKLPKSSSTPRAAREAAQPARACGTPGLRGGCLRHARKAGIFGVYDGPVRFLAEPAVDMCIRSLSAAVLAQATTSGLTCKLDEGLCCRVTPVLRTGLTSHAYHLIRLQEIE